MPNIRVAWMQKLTLKYNLWMVNFLAWQTQTFSIFVVAFLLPFNVRSIYSIKTDSRSYNPAYWCKSLCAVDSILILTLLTGLILSFISNINFIYPALATYTATSIYLFLPRNKINFAILARPQSKFLSTSFLVLFLYQSLLFWAFGYKSEAYATEPGNHDLQYYFDGIYQAKRYSGIEILNNEFLQSYSTSNNFYWGEGVNRAGIFDLGSFQYNFSNTLIPNNIYSISLWGTVFALYGLRNVDSLGSNQNFLQRSALILSPMFLLSTFNSDLATSIAGGIFLYFLTILLSDELKNLKWKLGLCFLISGVLYPELLLYEFIFLFCFKFKELIEIIRRKFSIFSAITLAFISLFLALLSATSFFEIWNAEKTPDYNSFYTEKPHFWFLSLLSTHNLNLSTHYVYLQLFFSAFLFIFYLAFFKNDLFKRAFVTIIFISIISFALIYFTKTYYIEHKMLELLGPSAWFLLVFQIFRVILKVDSRNKSLMRKIFDLGLMRASKILVYTLYIIAVAGIVVQLNYSNKNNRLDLEYFETLSKIPDGYPQLRIDDSNLAMPEDFQQLNFALTYLAHRNIKFCFPSRTDSELQGAYFNSLLQICKELQEHGPILVFQAKVSPDSSFSPPSLVPARGSLLD